MKVVGSTGLLMNVMCGKPFLINVVRSAVLLMIVIGLLMNVVRGKGFLMKGIVSKKENATLIECH